MILLRERKSRWKNEKDSSFLLLSSEKNKKPSSPFVQKEEGRRQKAVYTNIAFITRKKYFIYKFYKNVLKILLFLQKRRNINEEII